MTSIRYRFSPALVVFALGGLPALAQESVRNNSGPASDTSDQSAPEEETSPLDAADSNRHVAGEPAEPQEAPAQPPALRDTGPDQDTNNQPAPEEGAAPLDAADSNRRGAAEPTEPRNALLFPDEPLYLDREGPQYVASGDVIVSWSEGGDAVWGFSKSLGNWTKQEIQPAAGNTLAPEVGTSVAAVEVENAIYAYSGRTGRWDVLRLPSDRFAGISVRADMVLVTDGPRIHTFADSTGRWSSPGARAEETSVPGEPDSQLLVLPFVHADAQSMSALMRQLFHDVTIADDERTNTVSVMGSKEDVSQLIALAERLDQPQHDQSPDTPPRGSGRATGKGERASTPPSLAKLRENYNRLEQQAAEVAGQYRDLPDAATQGAADLKQQLAEIVEDAFGARQQLQRAKLDELRQRLADIEQQIAARERIKDAILERRVEELLNPDLQWDPEGQAGSTRSPTRVMPRVPRGTSGKAVIQSQSPHVVTQVGGQPRADSEANVQIEFRGLEGAEIACKPRPDGPTDSVTRLPGRICVSADQRLYFRLSGIPARAGLELAGTLELPPLNRQTEAYLRHNAILVEIVEEDVDRAMSSSLVTKAIYLPKQEHQELALADTDSVVSTRLDPGLDAVTEARRRGHVLAILRLGKRLPTIPAK